MRIRSARSAPSHCGAAFTLVEIIAVLGVLALLLGLLLPVLASARTASSKTVEQSSARQLMVAFSAYAQNNRDWVLPGVKPGLRAVDASGRKITDVALSPQAASRYPWRIAPYLDFDFRGLYTNRLRRMLEELEHEAYDRYSYLVSVSPSLGYNTEWIGGGDVSGDQWHPLFIKQYGAPFVRRTSEVRHSERLMVFSSSRGVDPLQLSGPDPVQGYHQLQSPRYFDDNGERWAETFRESDAPEQYGFLSPRYDEHVVSAFFDGHVDVLNLNQLKDMRHWSNRADRPDWGLVPRH